jgi:ubiquitin carboxyl-terminal hydrolase 1
MNLAPGHILHDRLLDVQQVLEDEDFDDKTVINKCRVLKKNWVKSTKSRQAVIARAPKSLVIHINRSIFDEMTGHQYKNNADIVYSKVLDLGNWCLGSKPSVDQRPDDSIEEAWPRDPKQSMIGGMAAGIEDSPFRYGLRAVVTHFGNHGNGHYICYRKHPFKPKEDKVEEDDSDVGMEDDEKQEEQGTTEKEQWWRLSDEAVREVSDGFVLTQSGVFMLFYERLDPDESPLRMPEAEPKAELVDEPIEAGTGVNGVQIGAASSGSFSAEFSTEVDASSSAAEIPLPDSSDEEPDSSVPSTPSSTILTPSTPTASTSELASASPSPTLLASASPSSQSLLNRTTSNLADDTELSETETTNYDSEGAPSTQLTSDDDAEKQDIASTKGAQTGPALMRTAGDVGGASTMGEEEGKGLRAVSAS